jgi:hypothetical protein
VEQLVQHIVSHSERSLIIDPRQQVRCRRLIDDLVGHLKVARHLAHLGLEERQ